MSRGYAIGHRKAYAKYRDNARTLIRGAIGRSPDPLWATATIEYVWFAKRSCWAPDKDNIIAGMKGVQDAAQLAKLVENDRAVTQSARTDVDKANPRVVVTIRPQGGKG